MKNEPTTFRLDDAGTATLAGDLTLDTVRSIFDQANAALRRGRNRLRAVDLGEVARVDSSGLALLLEWQAGSRHGGTGLMVHNAPHDLLRLARLCGAEDLLDLNGRTDADEKA